MGQSADETGDLIETIEPRFDWDDAGLSGHQRARLKEICDHAGGRGAGRDRAKGPAKAAARHGLHVLFTGPPGSGKTLAASLVAGRLGLDLYKIDLAAVVNKYLGETEKNLGRLFGAALSRDAVLLLDEADALFGKRGEVKDAHDRTANTAAGHLLQRFETYPGLVILATNRRSDLDAAFLRRLERTVEFPRPEDGDGG
jgi:SpoVK/Ycf46/Vps4 family AAA+-type ATPase